MCPCPTASMPMSMLTEIYIERKKIICFVKGWTFLHNSTMGHLKINPFTGDTVPILLLPAPLTISELTWVPQPSQNWLGMGHFHIRGWIKPHIWMYVISSMMVITETLYFTKNSLIGLASSYHRLSRNPMGMLQTSLRAAYGVRRFNMSHTTHLWLRPTRAWGHLNPSSKWVTYRNHTLTWLAYST